MLKDMVKESVEGSYKSLLIIMPRTSEATQQIQAGEGGRGGGEGGQRGPLGQHAKPVYAGGHVSVCSACE